MDCDVLLPSSVCCSVPASEDSETNEPCPPSPGVLNREAAAAAAAAEILALAVDGALAAAAAACTALPVEWS